MLRVMGYILLFFLAMELFSIPLTSYGNTIITTNNEYHIRSLPTTISESGVYYLDTDAYGISDTAITINADNVILYGNNHYIGGKMQILRLPDGSVRIQYFGTGIAVKGRNIIIKNLRLEKLARGIYISYSNGIRLESIRIAREERGIVIDSSSNIVIVNTKTYGDGTSSFTGIDIKKSNGIILNNVEIRGYKNEYYGTKLGAGLTVSGSNNITVKHAEIYDNDDGVVLSSVNNCLFMYVNSTDNTMDGIHIYGSHNITFMYSYIINNNEYGVYISDSSYLLFYLNAFITNGETTGKQIYLSTGYGFVYFNTPTEIKYVYKGRKFKYYVGNYYSDQAQKRDSNNDGINDYYDYKINENIYDRYPLVNTPLKYYLYVTVPVPPTIISSSYDKEHGMIYIEWKISNTYGLQIKGYEIYRKGLKDKDFIKIAVINKPDITGYVDINITANNLYRYYVVIKTNIGLSSRSNIAIVSTFNAKLTIKLRYVEYFLENVRFYNDIKIVAEIDENIRDVKPIVAWVALGDVNLTSKVYSKEGSKYIWIFTGIDMGKVKSEQIIACATFSIQGYSLSFYGDRQIKIIHTNPWLGSLINYAIQHGDFELQKLDNDKEWERRYRIIIYAKSKSFSPEGPFKIPLLGGNWGFKLDTGFTLFFDSSGKVSLLTNLEANADKSTKTGWSKSRKIGKIKVSIGPAEVQINIDFRVSTQISLDISTRNLEWDYTEIYFKTEGSVEVPVTITGVKIGGYTVGLAINIIVGGGGELTLRIGPVDSIDQSFWHDDQSKVMIGVQSFDGDIWFIIGLEVTGGIGVASASGGGTLTFDMSLKTRYPYVSKGILIGTVAIKAQFLVWEYTIWSAEGTIAEFFVDPPMNTDIYSNWTLIKRYYVDDMYDKITWNTSRHEGEIIYNIFPYTKIHVVNLGDKDLLFYITDTLRGNITESLDVNILLYNRINNTWIKIGNLPSSNEIVFEPKAIPIDRDKVLVIWSGIPVNMIRNITNPVNISYINLHYGFYDLIKNNWSDIGNIGIIGYPINYEISSSQDHYYMLLVNSSSVFGANSSLTLLDLSSKKTLWSIGIDPAYIEYFNASQKIALLRYINGSYGVLVYNNKPVIYLLPYNITYTYNGTTYVLSLYSATMYSSSKVFAVYYNSSLPYRFGLIYTINSYNLTVERAVVLPIYLDKVRFIEINNHKYIVSSTFNSIQLYEYDVEDNVLLPIRTWYVGNITDYKTIFENNTLEIYVLKTVGGNYSNPIRSLYFITTSLLPSKPGSITASVYNDSAKITWEPPLDPGITNVTGYLIYRNNELIASVPGNVTEYVDQNIDRGIPYEYHVVPVNAMGSGTPSESVVVPAYTYLELEVSRIKGYVGDTINLKAVLRTVNGEPLSGYSVDFYKSYGDKWIYIGSSTTDENGVAEIFTYIDEPGNITFIAVFNGTKYYLSYNTSISGEYIRLPIKLEPIYVSSYETYINDTIVIKVKASSFNQPFPYQTLYLYNGSTLLAEAATDYRGYAVFQFSIDKAGFYTLSIIYPGTTQYGYSVITIPIIVRHRAEIVLSNITYQILNNGSTLFILKAKLLIDGKPYPDQLIEFYKKGSWILIGRRYTDENGEAYIVYLDDKIEPRYIFSVNYTSASILIPSVSEAREIYIEVKKETPPTPEPSLHILLLLAILLVSMLMLITKKRRAI